MMPQRQSRFPGSASPATGSTPERRGIPFDYAFRYELKGTPGSVINSIVTVSVEATFTAVSIGYGVVPDVQTIIFGPEVDTAGEGITFTQIRLDDIIRGLDNALQESNKTLNNETGAGSV